MDEREFVAKIHSKEGWISFSITGGGTSVANSLLSVPGASNTVFEVVIPYNNEARLNAMTLGGRAKKDVPAVSQETVISLMVASHFSNCFSYSKLAGTVACTAALQTNRERRGADHAYIAYMIEGVDTNIDTMHQSEIVVQHVELSKSLTREQEESILRTIILNCIADIKGIEERLEIPTYEQAESYSIRCI